MPKRETEMFIREFWRAKSKHEQKAKNMAPAEFLYYHLQNKHGIQAIVAEYAYNLIDSLKRHAYDPGCMLFLNVIEGLFSLSNYISSFSSS